MRTDWILSKNDLAHSAAALSQATLGGCTPATYPQKPPPTTPPNIVRTVLFSHYKTVHQLRAPQFAL